MVGAIWLFSDHDQERQREHGGQMREEMRGADEELGAVAPEARPLDGVDIPHQRGIERAQHGHKADGDDASPG